MPAFLIRYPKGQGEDTLAQDDHLTLHVEGSWLIVSDNDGPCIAVPSHAGATITREDGDAPDAELPVEEEALKK